jgi:hypothetical protein
MRRARARTRTRRRRWGPAITPAVIAAALMLAACGSSSRSNSADDHPTQAQLQQAQHDAVSFGDCMRSHGVPNFPDSPYEQKNALRSSNAQSPAVQSAEAACGHLLAHGGQSQSPARSQAQIAAALAFARCIRSHGFPRFPDPTSGGQLTHEMLANAGIDLHQPAVLQAGDACAGVTHGVITKAIVARFVAGQ